MIVMPDQNDPWKHRAIGMRCATCMFFVLKHSVLDQTTAPEGDKHKSIGRCRRHAPAMNGYPVVFEDDWCGDHKLDEDKV